MTDSSEYHDDKYDLCVTNDEPVSPLSAKRSSDGLKSNGACSIFKYG